MNKPLTLIAALALGSVALPGVATAQYAHAPFFDHPVELSQAYGLETIALKLDLASAFAAPYEDELIEGIEGMTGAPLARFAGTLAEKNADLADALSAALAEVAEAAEEGEDASEAIAEARELLDQAYAAVIPQALRNDPAFVGGIIITLLLAEEGVAEGYEEAVEGQEPWEYPNGWVALQRVNVLWDEVKGAATEQHLADAQEMLDLLATLYPQATPPESVAGLNPEEAESPSQRLGGIVETVVDADLYPGRDLPRLSGHIAELTEAACALYPDRDEVAAETIYAVHDLYAAHLADVAGLFAPELQEEADELFGAMIVAEDDDDDEAGEGADDQSAATAEADDDADAEQDQDDDAQVSAAQACTELSEAFTQLRTALGG